MLINTVPTKLSTQILMVFAIAIVSISAAAKPSAASKAAARAFENAKGSEPELIHFLEGFPKGADLHNHLDGAVFSEHAMQSAVDNNLNYDLATNSFTDQLVGGTIISIETLKQNSDYFRAFREAFSIRAWKQVSGSGRDEFFGVFGRIFSSRIPQSTMLRNAVQQAQIQNLQHLELISPIVPASLQDRLDRALTDFDLNNLEAAFAQLSELIDAANSQAEVKARIDRWETEGLSDDADISVRYIGYILRMIDLRDFFVAAVANLAAVNADHRIVSLTLVMPEDLPDAERHFDDQMKILDFLWNKMGQPNLSLHAGELSLDDATLDVMQDRIRKSIDLAHSRRIGHGTSIAWEKDSHGLLQQMARDKTLVEVCLSSNEAILDIAGPEHPFNLYKKYGVPMSLNTDDEGITRSPLTYEFIKAIVRYDLSYRDVLELARNSLEYSFLEGQSLFLDHDYTQTITEFKKFDYANAEVNESQEVLLNNSAKLRAQFKFETELARFEQRF